MDKQVLEEDIGGSLMVIVLRLQLVVHFSLDLMYIYMLIWERERHTQDIIWLIVTER